MKRLFKASPLLQQVIRELIITIILLYCVLLSLNILLKDFVEALFPMKFLGWLIICLLIVESVIRRQNSQTLIK